MSGAYVRLHEDADLPPGWRWGSHWSEYGATGWYALHEGGRAVVTVGVTPGDDGLSDPVEIAEAMEQAREESEREQAEDVARRGTWRLIDPECDDCTYQMACPLHRADGTPEYVVLGDRFAALLREYLTRAEWARMRLRNAEPAYESCCASHDFVDANEIMAEAQRGVCGETALDHPEDSAEAERLAALWNEAWAHAKTTHLTAPKRARVARGGTL